MKVVCVLVVLVVVLVCLGVVRANSEALTSNGIVVERGRNGVFLPKEGGRKSTKEMIKEELPEGESGSMPNGLLEKEEPTLFVEGPSGEISRQGGGCGIFQWYSSTYNTCFDFYGTCEQYDGTDSSTCRNGNDDLICKWDSNKKTCTPVCLPEAEWYSSKYRKCFDVYGLCSQYDDTDASTCTTGKDGVRCSWNPTSKECN